jgi:hypothetical protein
MPQKHAAVPGTQAKKHLKEHLKEDGVTNPSDGRGPLRKSDDSSTKLPLHTGEPKKARLN